MGVSVYLAMTAAEIHGSDALPPRLAYMACHFSPYGLGLSNCPDSLPPDSILIINDRTPIGEHDPSLITEQVFSLVSTLGLSSVLLDFQRPDCPQTAKLCQALTAAPPCPIAVSDLYAKALQCPVFLPPPALGRPLAEHLSPWNGRDIWLEAALETACIRVTEQGSSYTPQVHPPAPEGCFSDDALHCHYRQEVLDNEIRFHLYRTRHDLLDLLKEAEALGVCRAVGLYQQLKQI